MRLAQGIRLTLTPCGPAAEVLTNLADDLDEPLKPRCPKVGFSADLLFSASGDTVTRIEKVFSVDLVTYPARGGTFLPLNQTASSNPIETKENKTMQEVKLQSAPQAVTAQPVKPLEQTLSAAGSVCQPAGDHP